VRYARTLGPGVITGASDDDPSGIATYAQAGAQFGYSFVWTALLTLPLMATVQEICDRTALATGDALGELCRRKFDRPGRLVVGGLLVGLIVANTLNITADLLAIGAGMHLLDAGPTWLWALVAGGAITALVAVGSSKVIQAIFRCLCAALIAYVIVLFVANVDWRAVLAHVVPRVTWSRDWLALLVAVLGTTISPYLFFWQSADRITDLVEDDLGGDHAVPLRRRSRTQAKRVQRAARRDVVTGMAISNIVMFAIIVASAATLGAHGAHGITGAAQAAEALRPIAGSASTVLFALGFIGSGMLAVPVLAGSGSAAMAGLAGRSWGFDERIRDAPLFYALIAVGTVGGMVLSVVGLDPIRLLVISAVINGIAAAPFLVVVMAISGDRRLMRDQVNGRWASTVGWATTALMGFTGLALVLLTVLH
jgi:NRAMP (natural resistance-associated macrophage protein)-like metal ion transporter